MNQAQALLQLQTVDLAINEHRSQLADVQARIGDRSAPEAAAAALQQAKARLAPWQRQASDLELQIKGLSSRLAEAEQRLYGGSVRNPKELQDLQEETASLKRRRANLEDQLLDVMVEIEASQAACEEAARRLDQTQAEWEASQAEYRRQREVLEHILAGLQEQRAAASQGVEAESLATYRRLLPGKRGYVVAPLIDNLCKACGSTQTSTIVQQVKLGRGLVYCVNCGRILVLS